MYHISTVKAKQIYALSEKPQNTCGSSFYAVNCKFHVMKNGISGFLRS